MLRDTIRAFGNSWTLASSTPASPRPTPDRRRSSPRRATRGQAPSRSRTVRGCRGVVSGSPWCLGSWVANRYGRKTHAKAAAHAVGRGAGRERRLMADVDWNGGETEPPVGSHHDPENRGQAGPRVVLQEHEVAERLDQRLGLVPDDRP